MKVTMISSGGQVQVPAEIRRRWGTRRVLIDDAGDHIRIRPLPEDPIAAAAGSLAGPGPSAEGMVRQVRQEEAATETRKWKRSGAS